MPRVVSFIVLAAVLLIIGSVFFQVVLQFAVPLFLAGVLVVVFDPLHRWFCSKLPDHPRIGALATTLAILLLVLVPSFWLAWNGYQELMYVLKQWEQGDQRENIAAKIAERANPALEWYQEKTGEEFPLADVIEQSTGNLGGKILGALKTVAGMAIGLAIMMLAVYYFFVDGPMMLETVMKLSPLEDRYEHELLDRFSNVSRAVVLASMLSAIAQGMLAGGGYYVAFATAPDTNARQSIQDEQDVGRSQSNQPSTRETMSARKPAASSAAEHKAPVMLLMLLTMVLAIVPFVGCAAVWVPTCLWLWLIDERTIAAAALALFCAFVVANVDNLIKPLVLHGQSNLHPLLALISVLGGVQVLGPVGIIVGPMLVAFVQALLTMVNRELREWDAEEDGAPKLVEEMKEATAVLSGEKQPDEAAPQEAAQPDSQVSKSTHKGAEPERPNRRRKRKSRRRR